MSVKGCLDGEAVNGMRAAGRQGKESTLLQ